MNCRLDSGLHLEKVHTDTISEVCLSRPHLLSKMVPSMPFPHAGHAHCDSDHQHDKHDQANSHYIRHYELHHNHLILSRLSRSWRSRIGDSLI